MTVSHKRHVYVHYGEFLCISIAYKFSINLDYIVLPKLINLMLFIFSHMQLKRVRYYVTVHSKIPSVK